MRLVAKLRRRWKALMMRWGPGMITCAEFESFVLDYHEANLDARQRRVFERHMAMCPPCRASFAHYQTAVALGHGLFAREDAHAPAPVPDDLVASILAARRAGP